jgi:hypothetical protein
MGTGGLAIFHNLMLIMAVNEKASLAHSHYTFVVPLSVIDSVLEQVFDCLNKLFYSGHGFLGR